MKFQFLTATVLAIFMFASTSRAMGPPPGPRDQALCPVTGEKILITKDTAVVSLKHGQTLYFSSPDAASKYISSPRDYWLSPHEKPLPGMDGKRGLPDLRNSTVSCPNTGMNLTVGMGTPRVLLQRI